MLSQICISGVLVHIETYWDMTVLVAHSEAERLLSAALRDSAPRRKAALLCARAAVRVALGIPSHKTG